MAAISSFFTQAVAFLVSLFMTVIPLLQSPVPPVLKTKQEDCLLNVAMLSDTHIEEKELLRKGFLIEGLKNLENFESPVDGVIHCGDITNYADEASLAIYYDIIKEYSPAPVITCAGNHDIGHAGDRDVTDITREQARENYIKYQSEYSGIEMQGNYFSTEINGYKFIVIGDECIDGGHWDAISMTDEEIAFLDSELAEGTAEGKPVFVCSHWPFDGVNGEDTVWDGSGIETEEYDLRPILEKYKNVFWISGHMHGGFKSQEAAEATGLSNAEKINGVTYLSLPTYGIVNWFGVTWPCTGAMLEVYENEVIFRPRNFVSEIWYENCEYTFTLD